MPLFEDLKVFTGNAHPQLARDICGYLGISLGACEVFKFSNDNTFVRILENVRERDVFIVQPIAVPVNDTIMELLIMLDAVKRASAGRITAVIPYYAYGRSDKKDQPRVPITARLLANLIETAGADRVLTIDLHAGQIQGFFNIPLDELSAIPMLARNFKDKEVHNNIVVVATDAGDAKRARSTANILDAPLAIVEKVRIGNLDKVEASNLIGDVEDKTALIVDDEIGTGGTVVATADTLKKHGANDIYCYATHGVLCGKATKSLGESIVKDIVVTDTLPVPDHKRNHKISVISVAALLGEGIHRIHSGLSVGAMFDMAAI
jgi:ribose-phosphate pyrophosphokinase